MATATLKAKLTLNDSPFQAGLKRATASAKKHGTAIAGGLKNALTGSMAAIAAAMAGVFTASAFAGGIKGAYDMAGTLKDLRDITGVGVRDMMIFRQAVEDAGMGSDDAASLITKMQKTIAGAAKGSAKDAQALGSLGLSGKELAAMSPIQQFEKIGEAISGIQNDALKADAAMDIFGKSGAKALVLLGDKGAMSAAASTIGRQAEILERNTETFDTISERLGRAGMKLQGFFVGAASALAPTMLQFTEVLDKMDFAEQGERFGNAIVKAGEVITGIFTNPAQLGDAFANLIGLAMANVLTTIRDGIIRDIDAMSNIGAQASMDAMSGLGDTVAEVMKMAGRVLRGGISGAVVLLYDAFINTATAFNALIMKGVYEVMEAIGKIPIIGKKAGLEGYQSPELGGIFDVYKDAIKRDLGPIDKVMEKLRAQSNSDLDAPNKAIQNFGKTMDKVGKSISKSFKTTDFGKGFFKERVKRNVEQFRKQGREAIDKFAPDFIGPRTPPGWKADPFANFTTLGFGAGGLTSGGLTSGGLGGGAYGQIRKGDAARAKAAAEREKKGVEKSNEILKAILESQKRTWEN